MCLCDTPGSVMLLGVFCLIVNVLALIGLFFGMELLEALNPHLATKEESTLDWAYRVASISYRAGSCLLSIGLIWGAHSVNRGLLKKVVIGTKIRIVVLIFYAAFKIYFLSTVDDPQDPLGIGKAKLIEHRSMGDDSWDMGKYANLDPKTMVLQSINFLPGPHVLSLAQKNPDNKRRYKKHDKKDKEDEEKKHSQKILFLAYAVVEEIAFFFLELFIVYRLDVFVKSLPQ
ncbi:uncharacterized protein [Dermacentor albipictus]|uniref:uncharacterized protein n=1 Tax=Dermacentor albipictus TaxID=60249 RepID=UPI0031FC88D9